MTSITGVGARHYLYDGLGSTRQLLDSNQNVTDTYQYEAFGNLMASTGATPNPYRYVGSLGYYQTGSSLQHLGARYYDPSLGRFLQQDPLAMQARAALGDRTLPAAAVHAHSYCTSNPVRFVDPGGLWWGAPDPNTVCKLRAFGRFAAKVTPVFLATELGCMVGCGALNWWNAEIGFLPCLGVCQIAVGTATYLQARRHWATYKKELKECDCKYPPGALFDEPFDLESPLVD